MKQSLTKSFRSKSRAMPDVVAVAVPPLQAVLAEVKSAFFGLCVQTGKEVLAAMMEADRVELCGAKGQPNAGRGALRGGHTSIWVTLDGRQVAVRRAGSWRTGAFVGQREPIRSMRRTLRRSPPGCRRAGMPARLIACPKPVRSARCRRELGLAPLALSAARLGEWMSRPLGELDLPVILVDGVHFRDRTVLIALGIDAEGHKHALGLREGSTENATVARAPSSAISSSVASIPSGRGCG